MTKHRLKFLKNEAIEDVTVLRRDIVKSCVWGGVRRRRLGIEFR